MQNAVTITVGMSVFNMERTVAHTISSIINQDFKDWEFIIIDDGSTDSSLAVARSFRDERIRIISDGPNIGLAPRLNQAVALSRGEYFARIDADDIAYPHRLTRQLEYLQTHPEVDLAGSSQVMFQGDGASVGYWPAYTTHKAICGGLVRGFALSHVTWMGKTEWFRANPYDPLKSGVEDGDLLIRTHRHSQFAAVPDILVGHRKGKRIPVRNLLRSRWKAANSLGRDGLHHREWQGLLKAAMQIPKMGFDLTTLDAGVKYRTLKRRVCPLSPEAESEWRRVWAEVSDLTNNPGLRQ